MERDAVERIIREQEELQRTRPIYTLINLILPVLAMGAAVAVLAATGHLARVSAAVGISFFTVGKLIIVFGAAPNAPLKLSPYALAAIVFYMDVVVAYVFAFNLHHVSRIPKVGPAVMRMQYFCRYVLSTRPWMRRWAFTGVMLFVMFPVTGTGAPAGSILGRIVGLGPWTTLIAIVLGSIMGCSVLALFAAPLEPVFHDLADEWWFQAAGFAVIGILVLLLYRLGRRLSRAVDAFAEAEEAGGDA